MKTTKLIDEEQKKVAAPMVTHMVAVDAEWDYEYGEMKALFGQVTVPSGTLEAEIRTMIGPLPPSRLRAHWVEEDELLSTVLGREMARG